MIFQTKNVILEVSRFDKYGYWAGNFNESVAKGTALGGEFTETLYTPSEDSMTGKYDANTNIWTEITDMTDVIYYDTKGNRYTIGTPEGEYPDDAITTEPPEYDTDTQYIRYEDDAWVIYTNYIGETYYDSEGNESTVDKLEFILPGDCSFTAPPNADEGTVYVLEDGEWVLYDDYRDQTVYSTTDMTESTVDYLGDIADGYTLTAPSSVYDSWDEDTKTWITDTDAQTEAENQATYKTEYEWAASELSITDVEVAKCNRNSSRAIGTLNEWYAYQEALCDYAHYSLDNGYSITYMTDVDEDSDDYTFKYTYDDTEYIISVDSGTGRPVAPSDA